MTGDDLEQVYREHLEEDIIFCLAERRSVTYLEAIRLYYQSRLAHLIHKGAYGIQYLNYTVLVDELEKELDSQASGASESDEGAKA